MPCEFEAEAFYSIETCLISFYHIPTTADPFRVQAKKELDATNAEVERIERLMAELNAKFETAKEERAVLQAETELMMKRLDAADRLINGLASENERSVTTCMPFVF